MKMKYIVLTVENTNPDVHSKRSIPIIFPACLSHSNVFNHISTCINRQMLDEDNPLFDPRILSAGFMEFIDNAIYCSGKSESLNGVLSRGPIDADLIKNYTYHEESVKTWEYY
jgi:hypothetical protein